MDAPHPDPPPAAAPGTEAASPGPGGWTGFWVVVWAACAGMPAALGAAALAIAPRALDILSLNLERAALREGLPPEAVMEPTNHIVASATALTELVQPWLPAVAATCALLVVAGVRLAAGTEFGRRATRWSLGLLVAVAAAGGSHLSMRLLPRLDAHAAAVRAALATLADQTGEIVPGGTVDALFDVTWVVLAIWIPVALVIVPSALLWLAAGTRSLRAWCASRAEKQPARDRA